MTRLGDFYHFTTSRGTFWPKLIIFGVTAGAQQLTEIAGHHADQGLRGLLVRPRPKGPPRHEKPSRRLSRPERLQVDLQQMDL